MEISTVRLLLEYHGMNQGSMLKIYCTRLCLCVCARLSAKIKVFFFEDLLLCAAPIMWKGKPFGTSEPNLF